MLESYFVKPSTADRVRCSWIAPEVERYVGWLAERGCAAKCVRARVPLLVAFGEFARARGARSVEELPEQVEAFVAWRVAERFDPRRAADRGVIASDLSGAIDGPQVYRLSSIPRSISWEEVGRVFAGVDRRTPCGKRDWAILMLLVTYGLRSREVAALTLDDIDWRRERLAVPERKAGHSTAFPLSASVGEALVGYVRHGRPQSDERRVFFRAVAPVVPMSADAVSGRARDARRIV